jgi:hypothetical protein
MAVVQQQNRLPQMRGTAATVHMEDEQADLLFANLRLRLWSFVLGCDRAISNWDRVAADSSTLAMATPDSSASDSEREEMKPVTLSAIPTLRYLYKNKTLVNVPKENALFPHRADLLDRVSL